MENNNINNSKTDDTGKSHTPLQRALASLALLLILGLVLALIYFLITGGNLNMILMILFCLIVVPCLLYIVIWFIKLINK